MSSENKAGDLDAEDSSWMRDGEEQIREMSEKKKVVGSIERVTAVASVVLFGACILLLPGSFVLSCTPDVCSYPMTFGVPNYDLVAWTFGLFVAAVVVAYFYSRQKNKLRSRINEVQEAITAAIDAKCPVCKKLSAKKYVGKELLSRAEHLGRVVDPVTTETTSQFPLKDPKTGLTTWESSTSFSTAYVPRTARIVDENYVLSYQCKFCNSNWKVPEHASHEA
jgi:hypothetical protein